MLLDRIKVRRSAGVPVSIPVHGLLRKANAARDADEPAAAAALFRAALERDPTLAHIWVQYGHMLRRTDDHEAAEQAYGTALALAPGADPHLHLGHLYKETGRMDQAARSYVAAVRADPHHGPALAELRSLIARDVALSPDEILALTDDPRGDTDGLGDPVLQAALRARDALETLTKAVTMEGIAAPAWLDTAMAAVDGLRVGAAAANQLDHGPQGSEIVFDVSDLISYFNAARLPTGIQRVQIEVIRHALRLAGPPPRICAFLDRRDEWVEIPATIFLRLCHLALSGSDLNAPEWTSALTRLSLTLATSAPLAFATGAWLVNLGTSWWLQNYFLAVRQAKETSGIRYVPFVHDLIPIMAGEHCTRELTCDFISWAIGAFDHADHFLVNSTATRNDLVRTAAILGRSVAEERIAVIRLDADFRKPIAVPAPATRLGQWGIGRSEFVLFVSTIESRKNHIGAFDAWISLIRDHGARRVPKLVCVGNKGWLNDAVYARLAAHEGLRDRVVMLSGLTDAELDLLYRTCLFTLYPSHYEGWGLPVTESLCYGKVPLISDASSLPEAGGKFAPTFEAGSTPRLTAALARLIFDQQARADHEALIARDFAPRSWADIAGQLSTTLQGWASERGTAPAAHRAPDAVVGAYHPIVRNFSTRIWKGMRSGEIYRAGWGWWGPDEWGCWTKASGGTLAIGVPDGVADGLCLFLQLHGLPDRECGWTVDLADGQRRDGTLPRGAFRWTSFDVERVPDDRTLRLTVEGSVTTDLAPLTNGLDPRVVSVGLAGFFLCATSDVAARARFLECVALSTLDPLAFNREPSPANSTESGR